MSKYKLNEEEKEILDTFESGRIQPIQNANEGIKKHREYAAATFKKDKRTKPVRVRNISGWRV